MVSVTLVRVCCAWAQCKISPPQAIPLPLGKGGNDKVYYYFIYRRPLWQRNSLKLNPSVCWI